jgi:chromosome segregation ATPase
MENVSSYTDEAEVISLAMDYVKNLKTNQDDKKICDATNESNTVLRKTNRDLKAQVGAMTKTHQDELQSSLDARKALEAQVAELQKLLDAQSTACTSKTLQLESDIATKKKEIDDLTARLNSTSTEDAKSRNELQQKLDKLTADLGAVQDQLTLEKSKNAENQQVCAINTGAITA